MSDNSQGLSGKAYARYKTAEEFRQRCTEVKDVVEAIIKQNLFFDFAFQLTAFEMRTKRDAMLQREYKIACSCRKGYFKAVKGDLQEDDECPATFFNSISAFMAHLKNQKCDIHHVCTVTYLNFSKQFVVTRMFTQIWYV